MAAAKDNQKQLMIKEFQPEDSPDKLASELGAIRSRVDAKIKTLQDELAPSHLLDMAVEKLTPGSGHSTADTLRISAIRAGRAIRQYPMTTALICGSLLAWLIESGRSRSPSAGARASIAPDPIRASPARPSTLHNNH